MKREREWERKHHCTLLTPWEGSFRRRWPVISSVNIVTCKSNLVLFSFFVAFESVKTWCHQRFCLHRSGSSLALAGCSLWRRWWDTHLPYQSSWYQTRQRWVCSVAYELVHCAHKVLDLLRSRWWHWWWDGQRGGWRWQEKKN